MIENLKSANRVFKKSLYLVSTPIGNLNDISLRAIETLKRSDYILCEDTRISKNLLEKYQIKSNLIANHKFNEKRNVVKIIKLINQGSLISLISDAGTPGISDPGSILVNECIKNDINIKFEEGSLNIKIDSDLNIFMRGPVSEIKHTSLEI